MTYLSREVWTQPLNWVSPSQMVAYDLRPLRMGFGNAEFGPVQRQVHRTWSAQFRLRNPVQISAYEVWAAALKGRLNGFWFAEPAFAGKILSSTGSGSMDIDYQGWVDAWDQESPLHILLTSPSGTATAAAVTGVTAISATVERVSFDAAVTPAAGWKLERLLYVRQADDSESFTWIGEGCQDREIRLLELPEEYLEAETGSEPIWGYRIWFEIPSDGAPPTWYYTSFASQVVSDGNSYLPRVITHGTITQSLRGGKEVVTVESVLRDDSPWAELLADGGAFPLWIEIWEAPYADPSTTTVLFTGRLTEEPEINGRKVILKFSSWLDSLRARVPWLTFGPKCQHHLYDARSCGVDRAAYQVTGTIAGVSGREVTIASAGLVAQPAEWFTWGWIETGSGPTKEIRSVLKSTAASAGQSVLTLNAPLRRYTLSQPITALPGCDYEFATCTGKFSNLNFSGTPWIPRTNLTLKAVETDGAGSGKK